MNTSNPNTANKKKCVKKSPFQKKTPNSNKFASNLWIHRTYSFPQAGALPRAQGCWTVFQGQSRLASTPLLLKPTLANSERPLRKFHFGFMMSHFSHFIVKDGAKYSHGTCEF